MRHANWLDWLTPGQTRTFKQLTDAYESRPEVLRTVCDRLADDLDLDLVDEELNEAAHETRFLD